MTDREREFLSLGLGYAKGIEQATVVTVPSTGREIRKTKGGKWECQPYNDNYWKKFDDLLDALRFATRPWVGYTTQGSVRGQCGHLHPTKERAEACLASDQAGCERLGGYSDRRVVVVGRDNYLYLDTDCKVWVAAEGGPTHGAMRFNLG